MGGLTPDTRGARQANLTSVPDAAANTALLAANPERAEAIITNDSTAVLYVAFGDEASATNYTARLAQYGVLVTSYRGPINGIWASDAGGAARVTETS